MHGNLVLRFSHHLGSKLYRHNLIVSLSTDSVISLQAASLGTRVKYGSGMYNVFPFLLSVEGPFLIFCGSKKLTLYLKVNELNQVVATPEIESASKFFLPPTNNHLHPHEFRIEYREEDGHATMKSKGESKEEALAPLPHYLNGTASLFGYNDGPLEVKLNVTEENARFVLHSRVLDGYAPVDVSSWTQGEGFYINCSRRRFKWDGYISVKETKPQEYVTAIVPSEKRHNDIDTWLLFRLRRAPKNTAAATESDSA